MFVLTLLTTVAGGGAAYWMYSRSDEGLRAYVLGQLQTAAPTLKIELGRAHFDYIFGRVYLYDLRMFRPEDNDDNPSLEIPEIIATLESTALTDFEDVVVQKLYLVKPTLRLSRAADGNWNLPAFVPPPNPSSTLPDLEIEHALVQLEFQLADQRRRQLKLRNLNVSARPRDARRMAIIVATQIEPAGPLTLDIDAALDGSKWTCRSHEPWKVPVDEKLLQLLCDLSPDIAEKVVSAGEWMESLKARQEATTLNANGELPSSPMKLASQFSATQMVVPDFGVRCQCGLTFRVQKESAEKTPTVQVHVDVSEGVIRNELLPLPLHDIGGEIYFDNRHIKVDRLHGINGATQVEVQGEILPSTPITLGLKFRHVELNDTLKARLPELLRPTVQSLGLSGICDLDATLTQEGSRWVPKIDLMLSQGTVTHKNFPVTVRDVVGELHLEKNTAEFTAKGKYAGQEVTAEGTILNPGRAHSADVRVKSANLPIDDESLAACPPSLRKAIEALRLRGRHDLLLRLKREPGLNVKYEPQLVVRIHDGAMRFTEFPFAIQQLTGLVKWKGDLVEFLDLEGVHDGAKISGNGTYRIRPGPGRLDLSVQATDAAFDRSLEDALPPSLRNVWKEFNPQGYFNMTTEMAWSPGSRCQIRVPSVKVRDGVVVVKSFPWALHDLSGDFSYNMEPGKLVINDVVAKHDAVELSASGQGSFSEGAPWRLEFKEFSVDNLIPNATFRDALPASLQKTFDFLRPTGFYSFYGPVEFFGSKSGDRTLNATWNLKAVLSRCGIYAGVPVEDINGEVHLNGQWDGHRAKLKGELDLDSISVFRHQQTGLAYRITQIHGPISFQGDTFVAGTDAAIPPRESDSPDPEKRVRGSVFDGQIFLDSVVTLGAEPSYRAFVELQKGRLERYAQQYLRGQSKLAGVMNGWINFRGKGNGVEQIVGEGKMIIAPAALYDSPLFARLFELFKFQSTQSAMFDQATANFTVANSQFDFNSIEMVGESLNMRGRGYIRFDGAMQLDFGLRLRQMIPNPFKGPMAVKVTGSVNDPKVRFVALPELDDAFRQFIEAFDPRKMAPGPGLFPVRTSSKTDESKR